MPVPGAGTERPLCDEKGDGRRSARRRRPSADSGRSRDCKNLTWRSNLYAEKGARLDRPKADARTRPLDKESSALAAVLSRRGTMAFGVDALESDPPDDIEWSDGAFGGWARRRCTEARFRSPPPVGTVCVESGTRPRHQGTEPWAALPENNP